jgi:small subunit ribosomal protein S21
MAEVRVGNLSIEKALKIFKRQVEKDGIIKDCKRKDFHMKPSVYKKQKQKQARKKRLKQQES